MLSTYVHLLPHKLRHVQVLHLTLEKHKLTKHKLVIIRKLRKRNLKQNIYC